MQPGRGFKMGSNYWSHPSSPAHPDRSGPSAQGTQHAARSGLDRAGPPGSHRLRRTLRAAAWLFGGLGTRQAAQVILIIDPAKILREDAVPRSPGPGPGPGGRSLMRRVASIIAAMAVASLAGCHTGPDTAAHSRPPAAAGTPPAAPSVVASGCSTWVSRPGSVAALVYVRTTLHVGHARAPQAGVPGLVTVSSIDVAFIAGGAQVGWATQAIPRGNAAMVIGNGTVELTATAAGIYLSGQWAP